MANNLVIWAQDAILDPNIGTTPLLHSGFNTLVLASFHIHPDLSIWFNGTAMVDSSGRVQPGATALGNAVSMLQINGGFTNVILSFGGGGLIQTHQHNIYADHSVSDEDFMAFNAGVFATTGYNNSNATSPLNAPIFNSLAALVKATNASGIDVDAEPMFFTYADFASAVLLFGEWASNQGIQLTWTPYTEQTFWTSLATMSTPLTWANIQPPAWGWYNEPSELTSWATGLGLPIGSIVAGFDNDQTPVSPDQIQAYLADCINNNVKVGGAYLWTYDDLSKQGQWTPAQIATAMTKGLAGITVTES